MRASNRGGGVFAAAKELRVEYAAKLRD